MIDVKEPLHRILGQEQLPFCEVFLKGVPQLSVTFISVLLNIKCNSKLCKPCRLNANDIGGV